VGYSPQMLRASAAHFPGVGVLVGGLVAALTAVLLAFLPQSSPLSPLVAAVLGTVFSVMLTGAFHEDGLADIADGLGGSQNRERALEIMKDSRVGAFGAIAVVLVLLTKVSLLAVIGDVNAEAMVVGIFVAHIASRFFPLLLIRLLPHVGDFSQSKSKPLADQISVYSLIVSGFWLFLGLLSCSIGIFNQYDVSSFLIPFLVASISFLWMWHIFAKRLQGFTGDCLGATQQVCEVAIYLGMVLSI